MNNITLTITIIDGTIVKNVCLSNFNKDTISFGRAPDNDIILNSPFISAHHGYYQIKDNKLYLTDNNSTNGTFVNGEKTTNTLLNDGDAIKIDNPNEPLMRGILMMVTYGMVLSDWKILELEKYENITIGRSEKSTIIIPHLSVLLEHATIHKNNNNYYLRANNDKGLVMFNNQILHTTKELTEKDVFFIASSKFIYNKGRLLYQIFENGIGLEAIDIVKTVKVKGKRKNISNHINLKINPGEFISIVGGSGAGKSTFLKCISGISKPTSGNIYINNLELYGNYKFLKKLIGYVPQQDIIHKDLKLIDALTYAADLRMPSDSTRKEKEKRIEEVLEIVELTDKKNVIIKKLSGGQKKRACIAVELIADPQLFFLDEPTSGLNPGTERSIMNTLRKMAYSGKTVIIVTHTTLNLHLCDKVVFFGNGGNLCYSGTPNDAKTFFGVTDFVDIYNPINEQSDYWKEKFESSKYYEKINRNNESNNTISNITLNKTRIKQFKTLVKRYINILINSKQTLLLLILQAPLIGYLISIVSNDNIFSQFEFTKTILFTLSVSGIWLGLLNSIQEIVKEKTILEKEYMADLSLISYLGSKIFVLGIISLIQSILLVLTFSYFVTVPENGITTNIINTDWTLQTTFVLFITIITASAHGLVISSLAKNSSSAVAIAPLLLIPQLLFCGIMFKLAGNIKKISTIILCRWSVEALGTVSNLNSLPSQISEILPTFELEVDKMFTYTSEHFYYDIKMMLLMFCILIVMCYCILKKNLSNRR